MTGIYKITSPSNRVYIGQSWDIGTRWKSYIKQACHKGKLLGSLKKYGFNNHLAEVIHELPKDVDQSVMDEYEQFYIDLFTSAGVIMLNIRAAGNRGKHSVESIEKMKIASKGKVITEEAKRKMSLAKKGKKHTPEQIEKNSASRRGKAPSRATIEASIIANTGAKRSDEARRKMSEKAKQRKLGPEQRRKIGEAHKVLWALRKLKAIDELQN